MNWLMNTASDNAFFIVARMHKFTSFIPLVNLLQNRGELKANEMWDQYVAYCLANA